MTTFHCNRARTATLEFYRARGVEQRRKILEFIDKCEEPVTANEIEQNTKVSGVRAHLDRLVKRGILVMAQEVRRGGCGGSVAGRYTRAK